VDMRHTLGFPLIKDPDLRRQALSEYHRG